MFVSHFNYSLVDETRTKAGEKGPPDLGLSLPIYNTQSNFEVETMLFSNCINSYKDWGNVMQYSLFISTWKVYLF